LEGKQGGISIGVEEESIQGKRWHLSLTLRDVFIMQTRFSRRRDNIKMAMWKEYLGQDKGICVN